MLYRRRISIPDPCTVHDFSLSPSFAVVYLNSYLLDMDPLLNQGGSVMDALTWHPGRSSSLLLASRETGEQVARIPLDPGYCLHVVNSFEEGSNLVLDIEELEEPVYDEYQTIPDLFCDVGPARPTRFVINTRSWEIVDKRVIDSTLASDFPSIDQRGARHACDHFWSLSITKTGRPGRKFFDQLTHVDFSQGQATDVWRAENGCYLGNEPIFIGEPGNDSGGVIMCKRFDAENLRDAFLIFDAYDVASGPIAVLHLAEPTPPAFHVSFHPPVLD
jgi:carotenoid cleavage dioxygenase-like enzyme